MPLGSHPMIAQVEEPAGSWMGLYRAHRASIGAWEGPTRTWPVYLEDMNSFNELGSVRRVELVQTAGCKCSWWFEKHRSEKKKKTIYDLLYHKVNEMMLAKKSRWPVSG
jgi:hypothetical protein